MGIGVARLLGTRALSPAACERKLFCFYRTLNRPTMPFN